MHGDRSFIKVDRLFSMIEREMYRTIAEFAQNALAVDVAELG